MNHCIPVKTLWIPLCSWDKQTLPSECIQRLISSCCGHGELSLVSQCRDRVRPWLPQHLVPAVTPCGLAQEQPQQPGVGHHLHLASAAEPSASPGAQVRACSVSQRISQLSAQSAVTCLAWPDVGEIARGITTGVVFQGECCHLKLQVSAHHFCKTEVVFGLAIRVTCA